MGGEVPDSVIRLQRFGAGRFDGGSPKYSLVRAFRAKRRVSSLAALDSRSSDQQLLAKTKKSCSWPRRKRLPRLAPNVVGSQQQFESAVGAGARRGCFGAPA